MHISQPLNSNKHKTAVLHLGFRPFFMGASVFAIVTMVWWTMILNQYLPFESDNITPQQWHAHEMIFGYALAVIAGFLLTAVKNWTNVQTWHQKPLLGLFLLWVSARLLALMSGNLPLIAVAIADVTFSLLFVVAIAQPLYQARATTQVGIFVITVLFLLAQVVFYMGAFGLYQSGVTLGIYSGFYLILLLILVMGRRVIPFFIEKGVDEPVKIDNYRWVDISTVVLYLLFVLFQLFHLSVLYSSIIAALFVMVQGVRLFCWYTASIWDKPLLWVLYLSYISIVAGFVLQALSFFLPISPYVIIHALAVGGIVLLTVGMMTRVSLGHTGRNVFEPPEVLKGVFLLLVITTIFRVYLPLIFVSQTALWILISQIVWTVAYLLLLIRFAPIWIRLRVDGRYG